MFDNPNIPKQPTRENIERLGLSDPTIHNILQLLKHSDIPDWESALLHMVVFKQRQYEKLLKDHLKVLKFQPPEGMTVNYPVG